jgi:MOSC domain-containing protein YiiM
MPPSIERMFAGTPRPLQPEGSLSAIAKLSIRGPWTITVNGLAGDAQGDTVHHGGPEKALHHYPREHYAAWSTEVPELTALLADAPAFGENISTLGLTEETVCIGDVFSADTVRLQVSQGRQPCWKLNARFEHSSMASRVQKTGRTGWYYRVLCEGHIAPGAQMTLVERPQPDWPLARVISMLYHRTLEFTDLEALSRLPELASGWRELAARRVQSRSVEDWTSRLSGSTR